MIKKLLLSEEDLKKHLWQTADKNAIANVPERFPCLLVGETYRLINGDFRRCLDVVYKEDVWGLVNQLEATHVDGNAS